MNDNLPTAREKALKKAEEFIRLTDPNYNGTFGIVEVEDVGYLVWQEVRDGGSVLIGNDGGLLFSNMTSDASLKEHLIQAYKDGKRTTEVTPEERAKADADIKAFMQQQNQVSDSQKTVIDSPKFDGPIGEGAPHSVVTARLSPSDHSWATVKLTITNTSAIIKYFAKPRIGLQDWKESKFDGDYFNFEPKLTYLGVIVKRMPYSGDELLALEPGNSISVDVDLSELYDFSNVTTVKVRYQAGHPFDGNGGVLVDLVSSDWITLQSGAETSQDVSDDVKQAALSVLNQYFSLNGDDISDSTLDTWNITPYEDAFVFSPGGGKRANALYIVRGNLVRIFSLTTETTEQAYKQVSTETLEEAKQVALKEYSMEDENLRALHDLIVKKEFPDGWVFGLEVKDPDQFTVPDSFLVLGKDGSVNWITPEDESAINDAHSLKECLELWGKRLLDEAARRHGSNTQVQDIVSGYSNQLDNAAVAVMGRTENNGVRIAVHRSNDTDEQPVVVHVGDTLGSLTDWKVTKIYEQTAGSVPNSDDERTLPGSDSGQKVLEITRVKAGGQAVNPFPGAPIPAPEEQEAWANNPKQHAKQTEVDTNSLKTVRIYDNTPEKHNNGQPFIDLEKHLKLDDDTKKLVLNYLKSAVRLADIRTQLKDVVTGEEVPFLDAICTDGEYWWKSGDLTYYVDSYDLSPNKEFVDHIKSSNGIPPTTITPEKTQAVLDVASGTKP